MIYLSSFLRRLQLKSALYFALPLGIIFGLTSEKLDNVFHITVYGALLLLYASYLLNLIDRKGATGIQCKICGFGDCSLLYPSRRKKSVDYKGDFACSSFDHAQYSDIYYCPHCRNGFLKEVATESFEKTRKEGHQLYAEVEDYEYIKNLEARYLTNSKLVNKYKKYFAGKDVLEVGAYYGAFTHEVLGVAGSYVGLEPSKHACEFLKNKYPEASIINGVVDELEDKSEKKLFDTIVLWDVIEHVPDPIHTLHQLNRFLKEDGYIIFSTINIESTFSLALGPFWPWFMDMHYYYFSDRGYIDMLHRSGFIMQKHHHFPYYVNFSYFVNKVLSILFGKARLPSKLERVMAFPVRIRLGDTVMIVGQKKTVH